MILETEACGKWSKLVPTKPQISQRVTPRYLPLSIPWLKCLAGGPGQSPRRSTLDGRPANRAEEWRVADVVQGHERGKDRPLKVGRANLVGQHHKWDIECLADGIIKDFVTHEEPEPRTALEHPHAARSRKSGIFNARFQRMTRTRSKKRPEVTKSWPMRKILPWHWHLECSKTVLQRLTNKVKI